MRRFRILVADPLAAARVPLLVRGGKAATHLLKNIVDQASA